MTSNGQICTTREQHVAGIRIVYLLGEWVLGGLASHKMADPLRKCKKHLLGDRRMFCECNCLLLVRELRYCHDLWLLCQKNSVLVQ